jgi:hypothetical protein
MKKELIGIFVCLLFFSISVFPVTGNQLLESKNIKTFVMDNDPKAFSIVRIVISGKGEVERSGDVNFYIFNLTESNIKGFALFKYELVEDDIKSRWFFSSFEITGPAAGIFSFFIGNIDYDPETEIFAVRGFALHFMGFNTVSGSS